MAAPAREIDAPRASRRRRQ